MAKALVIRGANFSENALEQITFDIEHATAIELSDSSVSLSAIGATKQLFYALTPADAQDEVEWTSSDTNVCTVSNSGLVTVVGCGECTITATAGNVSDECNVAVVVELSGYNKILHGRISSATASNRITTIDTSATGYKTNLIALVSENEYENYIVTNNFTKNESGTYSVMTEEEITNSGDENAVRILQTMGYPTPIPLPHNCETVRFESLSDAYGVYVLFFIKDSSAYPNPMSTDEWKAHFSPYRNLQTSIGDYTYTYESVTEVAVPEGYDSIVVMWHGSTTDGAKYFTDMTQEELASFKIVCK